MATRKSAISKPFNNPANHEFLSDPFETSTRTPPKNFSRPTHPVEILRPTEQFFAPPRYLASDAGTGGSFASFPAYVNRERLEEDDDESLNEEDDKNRSPKSPSRSTHRLNFSDSQTYNRSNIRSEYSMKESYVEVELLEGKGNYQRHSAIGGWENEGGGRRNRNKAMCIGLIVLLLLAVIIGVAVGVKSAKSNAVTSTPSETSSTASAILPSSSIPVSTTQSLLHSIIIPTSIPTFALPSPYSIAYPYAVSGVTTTTSIGYTIPTDASDRGNGQIQFTQLVTLDNPNPGSGSFTTSLRFRVPAPTA